MNFLKKIFNRMVFAIRGRHHLEKNIQNKYPIKVLNFQVTDACNSKCVMCGIWKITSSHTLDIKKFDVILQNPFFLEVEHIGISGGEPTLVRNLADYYPIILKNLPFIRAISLISNCVSPKETIRQSIQLKNFCEGNSIGYSIMLSLDGIANVHDRNRGIKNNYENFLFVVDAMSKNSIIFSTGTTITKVNVWGMDELLYHVKKNGMTSFFRIAEYINRLHNSDAKFIRTFDEDEIYQTKLFFYKLIFSYEQREDVRYTYKNIIRMLSGGDRVIACPYQRGVGINLDNYGGVSCCAPKDRIFAYLPEQNIEKSYNEHLKKFEEVKQTYCHQCIHDYHDQPLPAFLEEEKSARKWKSFFNVQSFFNDSEIEGHYFVPQSGEPFIFIIGWYGTETVGDKAILKSTVLRYKKLYPDYGIRISSLYPFVTERTLKELNIVAEVIPVYSEEFIQSSCSAHTVVVGGGPLMELEELSLILRAFHFAKKHGRQCHIYGCGIGPLHSEEKIRAVSRILDYADVIQLRDQGSVDFARSKMNEDIKADVIADPSIEYIRTLKVPERSRTEGVLACFLRELTSEYNFGLSSDDFLSFKEQFESALAENILNLCKYYGLRPYLYAMHNFVVGNDDRDFNYYMADKYLAELSPVVENKLATVQSIADAMQSSSLNLCMRFHSVVFANSLDTDYIGIDYTSGGKISHFLMERGKAEHLASMAACISSADCLLDKARGVGHFSINLPYKA